MVVTCAFGTLERLREDSRRHVAVVLTEVRPHVDAPCGCTREILRRGILYGVAPRLAVFQCDAILEYVSCVLREMKW